MGLKDEFAAALGRLTGVPAPQGYDTELLSGMLGAARDTLRDEEWFVFSEPLPLDLLNAEVAALRPAVEEGLVQLPFPRFGFIMRLAEDGGDQSRYALVVWSHEDARGRVWGGDLYLSGDRDSYLPMTSTVALVVPGQDLRWHTRRLSPGIDEGIGTNAVAMLLGGMSLLITPEVRRERVSYKPKQARVRASRGLPSNPVTIVQTRAWVEAARETDRRGSAGGGGSSPRPHLRRGHLRTLAEGRRTWVRPCIVGAEDASGIVRRERYEARQSGG